MLNPGMLGSNPGIWNQFGNPFGQSGLSGGIGPMLAAYGGNFAGQGFSTQPFGWQNQLAQSPQAINAIEDVADDIAERIADDIVDQATTGASALFQTQLPQLASQSVGGLNVKRWLNGTRVTDSMRDQIKLQVQQICRQMVSQLLNVIQSQWSSFGQQHLGGQGQFTGLGSPALAAYGAPSFGQPGFGQQNVAQLAPVVASILGLLQAHGQGHTQSPFASAPYGRPN